MRSSRRLPWRALACFCVVPCVATLSEPAAAQEGPSQEAAVEQRRSQAREKYEAGAEAYARGRYKDAVDWFLEADRLAPSAPLSFNVARAYERLGDASSALRWYRDYLRRSPAAPNAQAVRGTIRALAAAVARRGLQQVTILSTPAGATVTVDGQPSGVTPWTGDLVPGKHHVLLTYRGRADQERTVELGPNEPLDLSVELPPAVTVVPPAATPQSTAPQPPATPVERRAGLGVWPWITLGAGGASLGAALAFEVLRRSAEDDAENSPVQVEFQSAVDSMESRKTTARVLAGVGGALVVAGAVLLAVDIAGRQSATRIGLVCVPAACGVSAGGQF